MTIRALILALALGITATPSTGRGQPDEWTSSRLHIEVLLSALSYDRALRQLEGDTIQIGVLYSPDNEESVLASNTVIATLNELAHEMTFLGKTIVILGIPLSETESGLGQSIGEGLAALYMAPGLSDRSVDRVTLITRQQGVVTMTGVERYVELGVSLGVTVRQDRPKILINYPASKAEGARFSSQLLQLADVLGREEVDP